MRTLLVAVVFLGCGPSTPPAPPPEPTGPPTATLVVENVPLDEALRNLAHVANTALVVDPSAARLAHCARVSIVATDPQPIPAIVALTAAAIEPSGFTLEERAEGLVVSHGGDPLPAGCEPDDEDPEPAIDLGGVVDAPDPETVVRGVSDTRFELTRAHRDTLAETPAVLLTQARIVPETEDDVIRGYRLFGLRPGSFLAALGFQNGDTILSINEHTPPFDTATLTTELARADHYDIELERRGETRTHVVTVVDRLGD